MANKNLDVDILYDYLVDGDSQQTIADRYDMNQRDISNILTKDYGLNKGNVAWGTGKNNQKGCYSHLSYDDISDFVNSGSRDIDDWIENRYGNSDDYDDNYDDDYANDYDADYDDDYDDDYNNNRRDRNRKRTVVNRPSFDLPDFNGRFGTILLLILVVIVLSALAELKAIIKVFPAYLKLLWNGHYVYIMFGLALVHLLVRLFIKHETIGEIFDEPPIYYWLGTGFILAGAKLLFDMGFALIWPGAIPVVLGIGIIVFIKWLNDYY